MDMYEQQRELKRHWRAAAIERRKRTSADQRREAGRLLAEHALDASLIRPRSTVAAFASMGSEISMMPLLEAMFDADCRVLVPRLGAGMEVGWSELNGLDDLRDQRNADGSINTHRPQEPENAAEGPEVLTSAELILVPAFTVKSVAKRS